jgi:hypothetical protein
MWVLYTNSQAIEACTICSIFNFRIDINAWAALVGSLIILFNIKTVFTSNITDVVFNTSISFYQDFYTYC